MRDIIPPNGYPALNGSRSNYRNQPGERERKPIWLQVGQVRNSKNEMRGFESNRLPNPIVVVVVVVPKKGDFPSNSQSLLQIPIRSDPNPEPSEGLERRPKNGKKVSAIWPA